LGTIALRTITLGTITLGTITLGTITLGTITLGTITLGGEPAVIAMGAVLTLAILTLTLAFLTLGPVLTLSAILALGPILAFAVLRTIHEFAAEGGAVEIGLLAHAHRVDRLSLAIRAGNADRRGAFERRSETVGHGDEIVVFVDLFHLLAGTPKTLILGLRRLGRGDDAIIMLSVLEVILRDHNVAGGLCVARQLKVFFGYVLGGSAYFNVGAVGFVCPRQRIRTLAVIASTHTLVVVLTRSHLQSLSKFATKALAVAHGLEPFESLSIRDSLIMQRFDENRVCVFARCSRRRIEHAIQLVRLIGNGRRQCRKPLSFENVPVREPAENTRLLEPRFFFA
jgi:hypothetical protein